MVRNVKKENGTTPLLVPYEPQEFWNQFRAIVREELARMDKEPSPAAPFQTPGMTYKPLFKIQELCTLFQVSKPTIYEWIKDGKLKPFKIRSRVFFLWQDIQRLLSPEQNGTTPLKS